MAKKMMTEKERIEQWLTELAKNNQEFLSLRKLKLDSDNDLSICDGTATCGIQMFECLEYVASVLDLPIEQIEKYMDNRPQLSIKYAGVTFYQLGTDDE